jgi:hypothetical protein
VIIQYGLMSRWTEWSCQKAGTQIFVRR